ncbi:MAG: integrase arm-type DNA-binding domain-containing protein [Myxococcaceae bacterium]|nr:integrase arm-type DNA-binding domain-containing protein [Myxococcaceae bacterium]
MVGGTNKLREFEIKAWIRNPNRTPKKLFDGDGLFLQVTDAGSAVWRLRYRFAGKDRLFTIGHYPEIGTKAAREARTAARAMLRENRDPVMARRVGRAEAVAASGNTFSECAEAWLAKRKMGWSASHYKTVSETLGRHVLKYIGAIPVSELAKNKKLVADVVERLDDRPDTARKTRQILEGVFRLAAAQGKYEGDNPADAAREVISRRALKGRRAALVTWPELGDLLRKAKAANLSRAVYVAHRLVAFTAARMGNIVSAEWKEFDLDSNPPRWVIPRRKMKMKDRWHDHVVILGPTITAEIREWRATSSGAGYVFPAIQGDAEFISHESIEKAYRVTLGFAKKHSPHGWRAALATLARDNGFDRDAVEMALDHVHDTEIVRAYDRGERLTDRIALALWWDEKLVTAERGGA